MSLDFCILHGGYEQYLGQCPECIPYPKSIATSKPRRNLVREENEMLKQKLKIAKEALEFYADESNWRKSNQVTSNCIKEDFGGAMFGEIKVSGHKARQALKEIECSK